MNPTIKRIEKELEEYRESNLYRSIPNPQKNIDKIDLSSNSYLNLHSNRKIEEDTLKLVKSSAGNLASRLIINGSELFNTLEHKLAQWKNSESALVFNSGYAANIGVIEALARRSTVVFSDRLNHASIVDGIRLSGAKLVRYKHNDVCDLTKKIEENPAIEKIIVTDAVFSMDGDRADLVRIAEIADTYKAILIVDEAHSGGIFGHCGNGLVNELNIEEAVHITIGTFSKAMASVGGYFSGKSIFKEYLINKCRSFIYSTALPEITIARNLTTLNYLRSNKLLGTQLLEKSNNLRDKLMAMGYNIGNSTTQIIPIITKSSEKALQLSNYLYKSGIVAPAIRTPTVPIGESRVRLSVHLGLTDDDYSHIIQILKGAAIWAR